MLLTVENYHVGKAVTNAQYVNHYAIHIPTLVSPRIPEDAGLALRLTVGGAMHLILVHIYGSVIALVLQ